MALCSLHGWYDAVNWDNSAIVTAFHVMLFSLLALSLFGAFLSLAAYAIDRKNNKAFAALKAMLYLTVLVGLCTALFFIDEKIDDGEQAILYYSMQVVAFVAAIGLLVGVILATHREKEAGDTREITFAAICIALSFALSCIKLWEMPQGGSVTLGRMLPLAIYAYYFGFRKGLLAGFVYSMLELLQDPWIFNLWQVLLDYTVPFSAIAIIGLFGHLRKKWGRWGIFAGMGAYACVRYLCHLLTGALVFAQLQDPPLVNAAAWIYSATYNAVVFIDLAFALVLGLMLFSTSYFPRYMERFASQLRSSKAKAAAPAVYAVTYDEQGKVVYTEEK